MGSAQKSPDPTSGVYIVKNTMVGMGIKIKNEDLGEKNEKGR